MATITITVDDALLAQYVDGACGLGGYDASSGLTPDEFATQVALSFCLHKAQQWVRQQAQAGGDAAASAIAASFQETPPTVTKS